MEIRKLLFFRDGARLVRLDIERLVYIEADKVYCHLHMKDGGRITLTHPMSDLVPYLPEEIFVRINRSYIINIGSVLSICGRIVQLFDGTELRIGNTYYDILNNYIAVM